MKVLLCKLAGKTEYSDIETYMYILYRYDRKSLSASDIVSMEKR